MADEEPPPPPPPPPDQVESVLELRSLMQIMPHEPPDYEALRAAVAAMTIEERVEAAHQYAVVRLAGTGTTMEAWHAGLVAQLGQGYGQEKGEGMQDFAIANQLKGRTEFRGTELAHSDSRCHGADPARWVELDLWKTEAGVYVLRRVGKSRVFHSFDSECNRGVQTPKAVIPDDGLACVACLPMGLGLLADDVVDMEQDWPDVTKHPLPEQVVAALMTARREGGAPFFSKPARRLLELASEVDEGIRAALAASVTKIA